MNQPSRSAPAPRGSHARDDSDEAVAIGAAALALGAVVGFSLPRTEREDALLGATRDRVLHRASDAAHDAADAIAQLAEKTGETAKDSLQKSAT